MIATATILNLGAGVQSTTVYLLDVEHALPDGLRLDWSIFADTQEEPAAVYHHLLWLKGLALEGRGSPILVQSVGRLGEHLINGTSSLGKQSMSLGVKAKGKRGNRFASIPAFVANDHETRETLTGCDEGRLQRQCSKEYKVEVVERTIRRDILKLEPRQRIPRGTRIVQVFGISADEKQRAVRIRKRFESIPWSTPRFPLIELGWRRGDCEDWLKGRVPHQTPRSACVFCPYRSPAEWAALKATDPSGFARAVEIDNALRQEGTVANRQMTQSLYVHRKCIPLDMVDIEGEAAKAERKKGPDLFRFYCEEGMCGV